MCIVKVYSQGVAEWIVGENTRSNDHIKLKGEKQILLKHIIHKVDT